MNSNLNNRLFLVVSFILPITLFLSSFLANPSNDDYLWPVWQKKYTFLSYQIEAYKLLNGRILATLVSYVSMPNWSFYMFYKIFLSIYILFIILTLRHFSFSLINFNNNSSVWVVSNFIFFGLCSILVQFSTFFFWLTGVIVYTSTFILFTLFISLALRRQTMLNCIKLLIISFCIPLFCEVGYFLLLPVFIVMFFNRMNESKQKSFFWFISYCLSSLALLINLLGSLTRLKKLQELKPIPFPEKSLGILNQILSDISHLILSQTFVCFIIFNTILFYIFLRFRDRIHFKFPIKKPIGTLLFSISIFLMGYTAGSFILGHTPPKRTLNLIYTSFEISFILFLVHATLEWGYLQVIVKFSKLAPYVFIPGILIMVCLPNPMRQYIGDTLKQKTYRYEQFMQTRYSSVINTPNDTVYVPVLNPIKKPISLIFEEDLVPITEGGSYYNEFFAKYFGKRAIFSFSKDSRIFSDERIKE